MYEIVITGASGFIGSNLVKFLKKKEKKIYPVYKKFGNLLYKSTWDRIPASKHIIHCGYRVDKKNLNSKKTFHQNIKVIQNAIDYCNKVKSTLIFTSSASLYDLNSKSSYEGDLINPRNYYALSKYVCEKLIFFKCKQKKIRSVILRIFNIYGELQSKNYMIPQLFDKIQKNKKLNFYNFSRDYLYIDDLIAAIIKSTKYKKNNFEIFNIGSGKSISAKDLANMIARIIKKKIEFNELKKLDENSPVFTKGNIIKAKKLLNWKPKIKPEYGLRKYYLSLKYQA